MHQILINKDVNLNAMLDVDEKNVTIFKTVDYSSTDDCSTLDGDMTWPQILEVVVPIHTGYQFKGMVEIEEVSLLYNSYELHALIFDEECGEKDVAALFWHDNSDTAYLVDFQDPYVYEITMSGK